MIKLHYISFACALIAYVYSTMLTKPDMILAGWYRFLDRTIGNTLFFKPLINCFLCVSGQMALWAFLYLFWGDYVSICHSESIFQGLILTGKTLFHHVYFISLTIYLSWIIDRLHG